MKGTPGLVAGLLYGAGLRLLDGLRLRVQDIDFAAGELLIRDGKGGKDRRTMLPQRWFPICAGTWDRLASSTSTIWRQATAASGCRMRWLTRIRMPGATGAGSTFFSGDTHL